MPLRRRVVLVDVPCVRGVPWRRRTRPSSGSFVALKLGREALGRVLYHEDAVRVVGDDDGCRRVEGGCDFGKGEKRFGF